MKVFSHSPDMRAWSRQRRQAGARIAFVPTMGFLHEGHLSLIRAARSRADVVIVSIYVNPGQFAAHEDLDAYPRDPEGDREKLRRAGCDALFEPRTLYLAEHQTWLRVEPLEGPLCGKSRPDFFRGVATVVAKLFNLVEPDIAVFGRKDFQQLRVVERMVKDLDFPVEIVGIPLVREPDGLAMSSRNARLSPDQRHRAGAIFRGLSRAEVAFQAGQREAAKLCEQVQAEIQAAGGTLDYVSLVDAETLQSVARVEGPVVMAVAALFGGVRLIDNLEFSEAP